MGGWFWGMASKAIQLYHVPIDQASYFIGLWNFAVVGVIAIFYQKGLPMSKAPLYRFPASSPLLPVSM